MLIYESVTVPQYTTASHERIQHSRACCEDGSAFVCTRCSCLHVHVTF